MKFIATHNDQDRTITKFLVSVLDNTPLSRIYRLIREKDIKINGKRINNSRYKLQVNDIIEIYGLSNSQIVKTEEHLIKPNFEINYEDNNILVVEKPINIEMHSTKNSLDNQVIAYLDFKQIDSFKVSHISRLDKLTSGLVIYAKNYYSLVELTNKISHFKKIYQFKSDLSKSQTIEVFLRKDPINQKMIVDKIGKKAITKFIINKNGQFAILKTGRKHQIRATLAYLGFPILGDKKYGGRYASRLFLHCYELTLKDLEGPLAYLNNKTFKSRINLG